MLKPKPKRINESTSSMSSTLHFCNVHRVPNRSALGWQTRKTWPAQCHQEPFFLGSRILLIERFLNVPDQNPKSCENIHNMVKWCQPLCEKTKPEIKSVWENFHFFRNVGSVCVNEAKVQPPTHWCRCLQDAGEASRKPPGIGVWMKKWNFLALIISHG